MAQSTAVKVGIRPGLTVASLGHEAAGVDPAGLLDGQEIGSGPADIVLFFAGSVAAVDAGVDEAWADVRGAGRLWVAYRKGATARKTGAQDPAAPPLHRDTLQQALAGHGLTGVTLIALDAEWSALRVRPV